MAENPHQDIKITFDGVTHKVRPEFELITAIEAATIQSAYKLGWKIWNGDAALVEIATVLRTILASVEASPLTVPQIGTVLMRDGYKNLADPLGHLLVYAYRGHTEHIAEAAKKEAGPVAEADPSLTA